MEKAHLLGLELDPELEFETLSFSDIHRAHPGGGLKLLQVLLCNYLPSELFSAICLKPDFDVEKLRVFVSLNGHKILNATLDDLVSELSGHMLEERKALIGFDDFESAVIAKAQELTQQATDNLSDKAHALANAMEKMTASVGSMVQREWDAPYKRTMTPEMIASGVAACHGKLADDTDADEHVRRVFLAMVESRPENLAPRQEAIGRP